MEFLPIFIDLKRGSCLVVGGGDIAARKASLLLKAQAKVTIIAPEISLMTQQLLDDTAFKNKVQWLKAKFDPAYLYSQNLIIAATDDNAVNHAVYQAAKIRRIPVNVADEPDMCDFILASILDRSPIVVAISSGG
ncbi:MAG: bifunctional precorrin-2 dehydrogenase/sirohydrochlorin ferrochelatase, partial [Methylophaga sp.]|nr:bifunctional precorrin-2 dehydrogenase/sirohydrochlorin ferrochelatase [Methylophaga sp.]